MRTKQLIATSVMTIMLSTGGAFSQSSSVADGVQAGVEVIVMAPSTAKRQAVKNLVAELKAAGFTYIEIHRTFLGRARVLAISATEMREIILNPTTGEVLRDLVQENRGDAQGKANSHAADGRENGNKGGNGNNSNGNNGNSGGGS
ncbi:MAG: hypothetical protein KAS85_03640 [Rhodobacteraceae bacterium]|nr:hypothetical protein [Paracoccaceae bacterium]